MAIRQRIEYTAVAVSMKPSVSFPAGLKLGLTKRVK
jgi:hypothetical protein